MNRNTVVHPIPPFCPAEAGILILGSFPSVKSREAGFFYGNPQNRFWRVLSAVYGDRVPTGTEEKQALLTRHGIALWDVIASCEISGSSDASIRNVVPNDVAGLLHCAPFRKILLNGGTATRLYRRFLTEKTNLPVIPLPSTSPANASRTQEELVLLWKKALLE